MIVSVKHTVEIKLTDDEIDDMIRILHVAHEQFTGENRIDEGHCKTPYLAQNRENARDLIQALYEKLPCSWGKPVLHE